MADLAYPGRSAVRTAEERKRNQVDVWEGTTFPGGQGWGERGNGVKSERQWREDVLRRLERLADQRANDAVKLAFLGEEQVEEIDRMDLRALTELKRHGNGAVEIKLVDKILALETLCGIAKQSGEGAEALFQALERSTRRTEGPGEGAREVPDHAAWALGEAEAGPDLVV